MSDIYRRTNFFGLFLVLQLLLPRPPRPPPPPLQRPRNTAPKPRPGPAPHAMRPDASLASPRPRAPSPWPHCLSALLQSPELVSVGDGAESDVERRLTLRERVSLHEIQVCARPPRTPAPVLERHRRRRTPQTRPGGGGLKRPHGGGRGRGVGPRWGPQTGHVPRKGRDAGRSREAGSPLGCPRSPPPPRLTVILTSPSSKPPCPRHPCGCRGRNRP